MRKVNIIAFLLLCFLININSQVILDADGKTDTYELINSIMAPGYTAVEPPDCAHKDFGPHIDQVFDKNLGAFVFRFHIHRDQDNDRCKKFDRQRNEIKSYASSPNNLKAVIGETIEYKWKFKLDENFQASNSFTHIHQLKAVGGPEAKMPLLTITLRKKSDLEQLELRYAENITQKTIHSIDLAPIKGQWIEVTETVTFGEKGNYSITMTNAITQKKLLQFKSKKLRTWKTDADFIRPKWGIYRSLNNADQLRDEVIYFANFSIEEK